MYNKSSPDTIVALFSHIAPYYDRANFILSFGLHKRWNNALVKRVKGAKHLLDLCAGTGDIALSFLKKNPLSRATLLDFCPEMLEIAKTKGKNLSFKTLVADATNIPLPDLSCDAITIAYGIRNVHNRKACFSQVLRLLQKGGTFAILELTRPKNPLFALTHTLYLKFLLPLLGKLVAKDKQAYTYLSRSIAHFSSPEELIEELQSLGFTKIQKKTKLFGTATLISCEKS